MHHMCQKEKLESPFNKMPPDGPLPTLQSHIYVTTPQLLSLNIPEIDCQEENEEEGARKEEASAEGAS